MKKAIAVIVFFFTSTAFAASFDCSKAGTSIEEAICSHPELSALDEQLASAFRAAVSLAADKSQLQQEQHTWITQVRNKCEDADCLALTYQNRIDVLELSAFDKSESDDEPTLSDPPQPIQTESEPPQNSSTQEFEIQQQAPTPDESSPQKQSNDTKPHEMPVEQATTGMSEEKQEESGISTNLILKLLGLALLINAVITIYFHKAGKLIIYRDYTDVAFTGATPLIPIVIYFAARFFEVSNEVALMIAIGFFVVLMFALIISTARNNNGLSVFFLMSLITKITIVGLYYVIMAAIIISRSAPTREKGESQADHQERMRRQARKNTALMALATAAFVALSAWVCKYPAFTPIKEYFSPKATESTS